MASEMPVLPEVGSMIVSPGRMAPRASASSIMERAVRSLIEPVGFMLSSFARIRTSGLGEMRFSSTSGVLPMVATRSGDTAAGGGARPMLTGRPRPWPGG